MPIKQVAKSINVGCDKLLKKLIGDQLEDSKAKADSSLANSIFRKATKENDTTMQIFLAKVRLHMSEKAVEYQLRLEYEKQILDYKAEKEKELVAYKQKIGYLDEMDRPMSIVVNVLNKQIEDKTKKLIDLKEDDD